MRIETYKTRGNKIRHRPIFESRSDMENGGMCIACGSETSGVEPDARKYTCETCGEACVYGLEELLLMGIAKVDLAGECEDE